MRYRLYIVVTSLLATVLVGCGAAPLGGKSATQASVMPAVAVTQVPTTAATSARISLGCSNRD